MHETVTQTPDGIIIVTLQTADKKKTTRYFDSGRQMILDILEEEAGCTTRTRFKPDGHRILSIEVQKDDLVLLYQADGKTLLSRQETLPDGSLQITYYQQDGQTIDRISHESITGSTYTTRYQSDGITPLMLIEYAADGLTKTTRYKPDGITIDSIQEDLADGTIQKTIFRADGTRAQMELRHLKGLPDNLVRQSIYDESGEKNLKTIDLFLQEK